MIDPVRLLGHKRTKASFISPWCSSTLGWIPEAPTSRKRALAYTPLSTTDAEIHWITGAGARFGSSNRHVKTPSECGRLPFERNMVRFYQLLFACDAKHGMSVL